MKVTVNTGLLCFAGLILLLVGIDAHSYVTSPTSRGDQASTTRGCLGPSCPGPCELPAASARTPISITRGQSLDIRWPRNNHAGGFVRFAWAPTEQSDTRSVFDAHVQVIKCFETGGPQCGPASASDPNGNDAPGAPQTDCGGTINAPNWLTDGKWTLQWAWFGGAFQLADYFGCIDYAVSGGPTGVQESGYFVGGDYTNPTDYTKCKFFNTDELYHCPSEPCPTPKYALAAQQIGPAAGVPQGTPDQLQSSGGSSDSGDAPIACANDTDCTSGICQMNGYCYQSKSGGGLDNGGIAALFFAFLFIVLVLSGVLFAVVNKSEWSNWRPFNKMGR